MRAILHIGTEKTGTTSLQAFCHQNATLLRQQGIVFPDKLGGESHRFLAMYGLSLETADEAVRGFGIETQEDMENLYKTVETMLQTIVTTAKTEGHTTVFLSSEHLHSRLRSVEQISRVHALLSRHFDEIEVFVSLRPQVDVLVSLASTQARVGGAVRKAFFESANHQKIYYNYNRFIAAWEEVFGADALHCIAFNRRPDMLSVIMEYLGVDITDFPVLRRVNEALDVRVIAMINALVDSGSKQRIDFRVLDKLPVEMKLKLGLGQAREIQSRFEASNQVLIGRRQDMAQGDLQPKWSRFSETGNLELLETNCAFSEHLAALVQYYNETLMNTRI